MRYAHDCKLHVRWICFVECYHFLCLQNLRAAFYKFDDDHNGLINKANFRRILDSFMCIISDNEFEELCKRMGITNSTKISYEEFLQRFEVRDTVEGHKWLNSVHRSVNKQSPAAAGVSL